VNEQPNRDASEVARTQAAEAVVRKHVLLAAGAGLIPVPLADVAAITGIQLRMLNELTALYGVTIAQHRPESIIYSLLAGFASREIAAIGLSGILKTIPVFGSMIGAASMPLASAALTYAVGTSFKEHFAAGGSFDTLSIPKMRASLGRKLETGRVVAKQLLQRQTAKEVTPPPAPEVSELKVYCILRPKAGKYGKVYLKSYIDGWRPEKYLGTIDEFKLRYGVADLEPIKELIVSENRALFLTYMREQIVKRAAAKVQ
jgi:uncharacterized protein (DUF697 family)